MEKKTKKTEKVDIKMEQSEVKTRVNPLRKERIFVRFVPQENGFAGANKSHVLYGNKADGARTTFCVPVLRTTGNYKNILTNEEKDFLEEALGLDYNALSVYKKQDNYWDNYRFTIVCKDGLYLDLSDPEDYIKYKVLLANVDIVAPSVQARIDRPKATYQFEIVREADESSVENIKMDRTMASYKEFGKIESDVLTMRVLVELLDGHPYAQNTKSEFLRARINSLIQADPKTFLSTITDPLFKTKVIIRRSQELGKVVKKGDYYYLSDGTPLCGNNDSPTLSIAARYLNLPENQDKKFILESEVEKNR